MPSTVQYKNVALVTCWHNRNQHLLDYGTQLKSSFFSSFAMTDGMFFKPSP